MAAPAFSVRLRWAIARRRGAIVAVCVAISVVGGLQAVRSDPEPGPVARPRAAPRDPGVPAARRLDTGSVAVAVRLSDAAAAVVARPGDRVDVLAGALVDVAGGADDAGGASVVVRSALVLPVPGGEAGVLVVAVTEAQALRIAAVTGVRTLTVARIA